jgi:anti-sigma B factor antagonist
MELALNARSLHGRTVLEVSGEIDVYTAPALREKIVALVDEGTTILIVDLTNVEFLDSTGLGVLVGALKRMRGIGGGFGLVCDQERLLKIFRITGLDRVFTLYDSVEAASAGISGPTGAGPTGQVG